MLSRKTQARSQHSELQRHKRTRRRINFWVRWVLPAVFGGIGIACALLIASSDIASLVNTFLATMSGIFIGFAFQLAFYDRAAEVRDRSIELQDSEIELKARLEHRRQRRWAAEQEYLRAVKSKSRPELIAQLENEVEHYQDQIKEIEDTLEENAVVQKRVYELMHGHAEQS